MEIKKITGKEAVTLKILIEKLPQVKESKILKVLNYLQEEELVVVNEDGLIKAI